MGWVGWDGFWEGEGEFDCVGSGVDGAVDVGDFVVPFDAVRGDVL